MSSVRTRYFFLKGTSSDLSHLDDDPYRLSAKSPPKLRGRIHQALVLPSIGAGIWLIIKAPSAGSAIVAGMYALTVVLMLTFSSLFHLRGWSDRKWWVFRQLDHTGIYLLIAGTYLAIAGLALEGTVRVVLLSAVWGVIILFLILKWLPLKPAKGLTNALFIAVGWFSIAAVKWLWESLGVLGMLLLLMGGIFYTGGAIVLGSRKPDPSPIYFGYHEVWHTAVALAVICHYLVVAVVIF